jgi:hypothetical protein
MHHNFEVIEKEMLKVSNILCLGGVHVNKNSNTLSVNCSDIVNDKVVDILRSLYAKCKLSDYCWKCGATVIVLYRKIWDDDVVIKFFTDNLLDSSTPYPKKVFFSPISQTYLLHQRNFNTEKALSVYSSLNTHWQALANSTKTTFLYDIKKENFEVLSNSGFALYASEHDECIVQSQPIWNLRERFQRFRNDCEEYGLEESNGHSEHQNNLTLPEKTKRYPCRKWRMEMLAYYLPAHTNRRDTYGIHLTQRGIAKVAFQVHEQCSSEPLEIVILATAYMLLAHEVCHAWIEDLCCLFDFFDGENAPKSKRRYAKINDLFNSYIFMEEAICNTAAYGFLYKYLTEHQENSVPLLNTSTPTFIPSFNGEKILDAFENWMMKQPKGYSSFVAIQETPDQNKLFLENIYRLLIEIYELDHYSIDCNFIRKPKEITQVVNSFFGVKNQHCCNNLCSTQPPVHIDR